VNGGKFDGGKLSEAQRALRDWYGRLIRVTQTEAFTKGEFHGLNRANRDHPGFGRVGDETASGHWLYAFLRHDPESGQAFLVVANFHGEVTFQGCSILIPEDAQRRFGASDGEVWELEDRLGTGWRGRSTAEGLGTKGLELPPLPPCSALILEFRKVSGE
jgi:hypothetical protein